MAFTDHKISAFTHTISELADQPNLPPDELKARFDACPEQLRVSLNAVCDEAAALDGKVDGILTQTFEGAIDKSMLSPELAAEIDATITEDSVTEQLSAEAAARESADSALSTRVTSLENTSGTQSSQIAQKCQIYVGGYTGDDQTNRFFSLGFEAKAVLIFSNGAQTYYNGTAVGGLMTPTRPLRFGGETAAEILSSGFRVYDNDGSLQMNNRHAGPYTYIAFR